MASFDTLYNAFFPLKTKKHNKLLNPREPWMSNGILISRKRKNQLSNTCIKTPTPFNRTEFKKYRNLYNSVIRNAKKLYFEKQLLANQKNLRKTWQILFSTIHKSNKKTNDLNNLVINGVNLDDPALMACHFNNFFTTIASFIQTVADAQTAAQASTWRPTALAPQAMAKVLAKASRKARLLQV